MRIGINLNKQIGRIIGVCCLAVCAASGTKVQAQNLLSNGSFTSGNIGFSTDYANYYATGDTYTTNGSYTVGTNPSLDSIPSEDWENIGDHTTGSGNMLEIDGDTLANRFWYETVAVVPATTYVFSYWATSINPSNSDPAQIQLTVNGTAVGSPVIPTSTGVTATTWTNYTETWYSGANTGATVALSDLNTQYAFNDFAVDDLSFAVPEPASLSLLGLGGVSLLARRRWA